MNSKEICISLHFLSLVSPSGYLRTGFNFLLFLIGQVCPLFNDLRIEIDTKTSGLYI